MPAAGSAALTKPRSTPGVVRFVALGDSYTIGTGVKPRDRWPNQLVRALRPEVDIDLIGNLAVTGATSGDVLQLQVPQLDRLDPDLVTILVGVNDVTGHLDSSMYRTHVAAVLDGLLRRVSADRILVITTPDYTLTPQGGSYGDRSRQRARIVSFNEVLEAEASKRHLALADITPVADLVPRDASLVASDGLHPSAKQYAGWVEMIAPEVRQLVGANP
jgi:acyl-CoA thioesterase-1